jgi:hypothetical protein
MKKYIPYDKLSKKQQRELDLKKRRNWGGICPVTRKSPDPKAYNRRKIRPEDEADSFTGRIFLLSDFLLTTGMICAIVA